MGERMRAFDWARHPLGRPDRWPQALRTVVRLMLTTRHPMFIFWGADLTCFYNDAYSQSIGPEKHPAMLGARGRDMWREVWPVIGPQIDLVMTGAGATWHEDQLVPIIRRGKLDEVYWTYSYSPIDDEGRVGGVLVLCTETTQRILAEQHERAQLGRLREVFLQAPSFVAMLAGPEHSIEFVNEAGKQLVGGRDNVGKTVREALPDIDEQGLFDLDEVYRRGESLVARGRRVLLQNADGEAQEFFLDYICQPMRDGDGAVDGVFVVGYDVTERIRATEALRRSERRFRGAVDAAQATLWTNNPEGRMKGEQPGWAALTGQSYEEYQDYGWARAVHPDDAQPTIDAWNEAVAAQKPFAFEHRVKRADGEWRLFSVRAIPLLNEDGAVEEWVGVHTDVTEQRRARDVLAEARERLEAAVAERTAALQQSEARIRTIFETSHSFQGLLTPDGVLLDANATSLAAIEAQRKDVVGKPLWETPWFAGTPGTAEAVKRAVARVAAGASGSRPVTVNLPTGVRSFDFSMRPVKNERGEVVAIVPEAVETTARLKAEAALRQAQALEAVGQLTGGVAHDFNNLLMVVAGGLTLMERRDDPARRPMLIAHMREAVDRGAALTRQLLAFSRKQDLTPEIVNFAKHLDGMRDLLARSLGANIRIEVETTEDVAPIFVDPMALQLAILNLAVNARDAMPEGGTIAVKAANGAPDNPRAPLVSISVVDSGIGMTPQVQARIFEPFYTTKEIGRGSGLGLAQVHGFAQQSGGRIEVRSRPGAGTTMILILPASESGDRPVVKPAVTFRAERATREAGDALLIEDNDEVAALTREMLELLGWHVTRVASAEAALGALADERKIDLVFSDVMMPGGMSGLDLAREARRRRPTIPIVLTSGYAEPIKREAEQAGLPLLPKPFNLDTLAAVLEVALLS